jgi:hypothetical protein
MNAPCRALWSVIVAAIAVSCSGPSSPTVPKPSALEIGVAGGGAARVAPGSVLQLWARARAADGTLSDVTNQAAWRSSQTGIATVAPGGTIAGISTGDAEITASFSDLSASVHAVVAAPGCEASTISPPALSFSATRTLGCSDDSNYYGQRLTISSPVPGCRWTAKTDVPWISLGCYRDVATYDPATTQEPFAYTLKSNNSPSSRTGHVIVAFADGSEIRHTVTQDAPLCSFVVSPQTASFPREGGTGTVDLTVTPSSCKWAATGGSQILFPGVAANGTLTGQGSASISYTVQPNPYSFAWNPGIYIRPPFGQLDDSPSITFTVMLAGR